MLQHKIKRLIAFLHSNVRISLAFEMFPHHSVEIKNYQVKKFEF